MMKNGGIMKSESIENILIFLISICLGMEE